MGRYVDSLLAALDAAGAPMSVACQPRDACLYREIAPQSRVIPASEAVATRTARLTWEQTTLPRLARRIEADVVHSPHYTFPVANPVASVVTLHDATFFSAADLHTPVKRRFFRAWTRAALHRASLCVVPSRATAGELERSVGARRSALRVTYHGVDPLRFHVPSPEEIATVRRSIGLGARPYVAFLGTLEPRKNVSGLIRGFARACRGRTDDPVLVLAGQSGWDSRVEEALDSVPHRVRIIRAGYQPFERLAGFLGGATVVAYPSFGEGFGLPVLEAMATGAAVLTTNRLSLPEVGGDAVAYCEPDERAVGSGLAALLDDPARRSELSTAAQQRAKEFTWSACADRHREAYAHAHFRHRNTR